MSTKVDLYDNAYAKYGSEVYRQIRVETYGQDLGQTSWVTHEESSEIPRMLHLEASSSVLEIGCGSGAYALQLAGTIGCSIAGVDVNESGVQNANQLAETAGLAGRARFQHVDASKTLPFENDTFDAVFANDVLCHIPARSKVLSEMLRVLKPGGRMLFSDALVIGGLVTHEEIATRSSIGYYVYSPPGENERLMEQAGFREIHTTDTTESAALISKRWLEAREKRSADLGGLEGPANFKGLQAFLSCVHSLTSERRLLRYLYRADKRR
jgi:SAM-dependent methyltransferase